MGDTDGEQLPELRVGHAERQAAMRALDAHLEAGRLSVEEYGDRSGAASVAVYASDLTALFLDLPAPHPPMPRRPGDDVVAAGSGQSGDVRPTIAGRPGGVHAGAASVRWTVSRTRRCRSRSAC